jgi:hypothetical protein
MKIVESNDRSLEIVDRNHQYLWGLLLAIPFITIGSIVGAATIKVTSLECQRDRDIIECQRSISGILGTEQERIPGRLQSVSTVTKSGVGLVLGTTTGTVELAPYRAFVTSQHFENADRIAAFLKNPQQTTIRIEQDDRWINSLWSGNFLVGGLTIALFALAIPTQISCKFDRDRDRVILDKKYLLYGDRQTMLPLSTIKQARLTELIWVRNREPVYSIELMPIDTKKISFSVPSTNLAQYQQIVDAIEHFLHH